jgi:predicted AAA+ superfamily ATPase
MTAKIHRKLQSMPAVGILGPRQCGKTTLAQHIIKKFENAVYLDLERRTDLNKLRDPEAFFEQNSSRLICLDEIQRLPDLFPEMRSHVDRYGRNGRFLILGSASPELLRQTSETLAGRISFIELTPLSLFEVSPKADNQTVRSIWLRGGFPRSYLARSENDSFEWRQDFIRTFLERDIPQLGINIPARRLERFWQMVAHIHGQLLNRSSLGESLGVSHHTVNSYVALLEQTYLLRVLEPYHANVKKRLIKAPKIYLRDSGLLHGLLDITTQNDLLGNPVYGASWEGFVIENTLAGLMQWRPYFYRSASGAEIDLILERGQRRVAIEIKASTSPEVKRGFWNALEDLRIDTAMIVSPVDEAYPYKNGVQVIPLNMVQTMLE